jgi:hypothetical protein
VSPRKAAREAMLTTRPPPFAVIAFGLIAYGVYQIINAKYRRIDVA